MYRSTHRHTTRLDVVVTATLVPPTGPSAPWFVTIDAPGHSRATLRLGDEVACFDDAAKAARAHALHALDVV